ncbi:MAG: PKD domain-containing protein [Planctomycetota bacterium]|jgi:hypothetical protein
MSGNIEMSGANIAVEGSVYIESENDADALSIIGNSVIAGDVFITNPNAVVNLQGGQASIGGETGQAAIDNHVNVGVDPMPFAVPNPGYFLPYVQNTYDPNNVLAEYENVVIPAGTNPVFGAVTLKGVVFIQVPNVVTFTGDTDITGIIVGDGDLNDNSGTNLIFFLGTVISHPVTDLPYGPQFEHPDADRSLHDETGTFLMAPGFAASFGGDFDTLSGAIAANGIDFFGDAGGTVDGSVINYSPNAMTLTGNNDLYFYSSGTSEVPAGFEVVPLSAAPVADADGPYAINVGDTLTLDANDSTDDDNDIVSYVWDLDDNNSFETDAGTEPIFDVNYTYLQSLGLLVNHTYTIHLKVTDSEQQSDIADSTLTIVPKPALAVAVDIKPTSCPNPMNIKSSGVLRAAILGTEDVDVTDIDATSILLAGVGVVRSSYEDVATPVADSNDCNCTTVGPDGLLDLTLKFKAQDIVEELLRTEGELVDGEMFMLELTGVLYGERPIEGADCVLIKGKVPKGLATKIVDTNQDGVIDFYDFSALANQWLQTYGTE